MGKETRFTNGTTGGPVFVYVKDGRIVRVTPIEFDEKDAASWAIKARGKTFSPPRNTTLSPYSFAYKSMVYSPKRNLYPMKRVDFDPTGKRIVIVLTGHGLKDPGIAVSEAAEPLKMPADINALDDYLGQSD